MALVLITAMVLSPFNYAGAVQGGDRGELSGEAGGLLQFRAGRHIIAFTPGRAYLASPDHALIVSFVGADAVMPGADGIGSPERTPGTATLGRVTYQGLWEGIDLTYEAAGDGISESTYHVAPGADVARIRLRYNVPVDLQKEGSLKFRFEK
jgi:hypothetical protein